MVETTHFLLFSCVVLLTSWQEVSTRLLGQSSRNVDDVADSVAEGLLRYAKTPLGASLPQRVDLVFVLDSSYSIGGHRSFRSAQALTKRLIQEFSVSPSTTRVALVLCSTEPTLYFDLGHHVNKEGTLESLETARFEGGPYCSLSSALSLVHDVVLRRKPLAKTKTLVFLMTKSPLYDSRRSVDNARRLRSNGVKVFRLAAEVHAPSGGFDRLASWPLKRHSFCFSFHQLEALADSLDSRGHNLKCAGNDISFLDECMRRCECSAGRLVNCARVRKDFPSMSREERERFVSAIKKVSTSKYFKRTYAKLAYLHPRYFNTVHKRKYFFPWHRWYILTFENLLRRIDCRVTVPYWDWARAFSGKRLFRASHMRDVWYPGPHGLGSNGVGWKRYVLDGPFRKGVWPIPTAYHKTGKWLTRNFNSCFAKGLMSADDVQYVWLKRPLEDFELFELDVRTMHDQFHNSIGGIMELDVSSYAPEFWFHHGFLDKLWNDWQNRGPKFKFQYYHTVKSKLPGAGVHGTEYVDLSRQPGSVRVVIDQPKDDKEIYKKEEFDPFVRDSEVNPICDDSELDKNEDQEDLIEDDEDEVDEDESD